MKDALAGRNHTCFFANKIIPEDTEHTKHFKWNDVDGFYDHKEWNPVSWGLELEELKTVQADCSILTQNYILSQENSNSGKLGKIHLRIDLN